MSEENQNTEQIAPPTESDDNVDYKALYLASEEKLGMEVQNSIKQRKRAQTAEQSISSSQMKAEEARKKVLLENERYKELYEASQKEVDEYKPYKEGYIKRESQDRERLLAKLPEEDRERLGQKDIDTLEYIVSLKEESKPSNPKGDLGLSRKVDSDVNLDWTSLDGKEGRANYERYLTNLVRDKN